MVKETGHTGGLQEVKISNEDIERWENEDTESTKDFKKGLKEWQNKKKFNKKMKGMPPVYETKEKSNIVDKTHHKDHLHKHESSFNLDIKKTYKKIKYHIGRLYRKVKRLDHDKWFPLIRAVFLVILSSLLVRILYSNVLKLNSIDLFIFKLGSILLLGAIILLIKQLYALYKSLRYHFRRQNRWIKTIIAIVIFILLWQAYQQQDSVFDPLLKVYDDVNMFNFLPLTFEGINMISDSKTKVKESSSNSAKDYVEEVLEYIEIKPLSIEDMEKSILKYTNIQRSSNGLQELIWDENIGEIARSHSLDMVENNFFDHINLNGEDPTNRAQRMGFNREKEVGGGYFSYGLAENIGQMPTGNVVGMGYIANNADSVAKAHVDSWMESPGHRENILNSQYTHLGVGVAYDGLYYVATQNFW
jgi:uncharacterized protein YkwD